MGSQENLEEKQNTEGQERIKQEKEKNYNRKARTKFQRGLEFYNKKDFSNAVKYFEKSIQEDDADCIKSMYFIGKIHMYLADKKRGEQRKQEYKKAEEQFEKCIAKNSEDLYTILELGKLYLKQENIKNAYKQFKRYIEIDKDNTSVGRLWLGKLYVKQREYEKAEIEYEKAIDLEKNTQYARLQLGKLYEREAKYEEAKQKYIECLEFNNKDVLAKNLLQDLIKRLDKKEKITSSFFEKKEGKAPKLQYLDEMQIRKKIYLQTITEEDIKKIKELIENNKEEKENYLVLIAMYERNSQKQNALNVIKQMQENNVEVKEIAKIKERLKSKKNRIFDMAKWDELIGWDVSNISNKEEIEQETQIQIKQHNNEENIRQKNLEEKEEQDKEIKVEYNKEKETIEENRKSKYIVQEGIKAQYSSKQRKSKDEIKEKNSVKEEERKIRNVVGTSIKESIDKIGRTYYVQMQIYNDGALNTHAEIERRQKYIKKYDKLESILECSEKNKRAKMELILVLMNEGYSKVVQKEYPTEYEYINKLVEEYKNREKTAEKVKKEIDEYCL